jgi:quercetin dioxygenase-like cupin family protein
MNKYVIPISVFAAVAAAIPLLAPRVHGQGEKEKGLIYASSEKATYTQKFPGVSIAVVWGDPDTGPNGSFTKFAPGCDNGIHIHTNDIWCLVFKGAYLYKDEAGEKRVGPGEFLRIPGGHKHWSGGDKRDGVLMYVESAGKFDKIDAK